MNIYKFRFDCECPNNNERIQYSVEISTTRTVMVENIAAHFLSLTSAFHEDIADEAFQKFGGHQVIKAHHHGVDVETRRGDQ